MGAIGGRMGDRDGHLHLVGGTALAFRYWTMLPIPFGELRAQAPENDDGWRRSR
jgi:hypothetical protein